MIKQLQISHETKWQPNDFIAIEIHHLTIDENGVGNAEPKEVWNGKVIEINENNNITKVMLEKPLADGKFLQQTIPLKKCSSLMKQLNDGSTILVETYEPYYKPDADIRYLFGVIGGARDEQV